MLQFLKRALANPQTTFGLGGAIVALLTIDLSDGQPFTALKALKIAGGMMGIFGALAARDAATPASALPPVPPQ